MNEMDSSTGGSAPKIDEQLEREINEALDGHSVEELIAHAGTPPGTDGTDANSAPRFEHEVKRGRIASVHGDDVFVEVVGLPGKNQGVVPLKQFERAPRIGSIMDFVVERVDETEGLLILSREGAVSQATWDHLQRGAVVEARVVGTNKGGLELEMIGGIRAFMPASQIDLHHVDSLETLVGQRLHGLVQEINRKSRKVVLSRRQYLIQDRQAKQKLLWEQLEEGQERTGVVSNVTDYGAFVDLGGLDGLVHISDLSYTHVKHPSEVVTAGQQVTVRVLKVDREKERVSLGLKQATTDPWQGVEQRMHVGDRVSGRVVRLTEFGAFVELEPGIEGLVPLSEMSWKRIGKASEVLNEGDTPSLAVLQVDPQRRRISLSLKQVDGDPWIGAERRFATNSIVEATVRSITDFGAFVELIPGVEGLVHISELSDKRVNSVAEVLKVGDKQQLRVLEVDEENRRIRMSLKQVDHPAEPQDAERSRAESHAKTAPAFKTRESRDKFGRRVIQFSRPRSEGDAGKKLKGGLE